MKRLILVIAAIAFSLNGFSQPFVSDSLVAHYPFDGNARDETGNGYDGIVYGATLSTDRFGNPNSAYEFDGINDYINTFSTFDFELRTMSLWFQPYDIQGNVTTEKHIAGQDAITLEYGQLKAKFRNGNLLVRAGGETRNHVINVDSPNIWYHLVLVRDSTFCKYYLNNNLVGTSFSGSVGSSFAPNEDFVIGVGRKLIDQFFIGKIDDIRIYKRVLSTSEIDCLFSEAAPVVINCPANVVESSCQTQSEINNAFDSWIATASASGGCDAEITNTWDGSYPDSCGGAVSVEFTATDTECCSTVVCSSTFTVESPDPDTPNIDSVCNNIEVYPNPVRYKLYLKSDCEINSARLFDTQGKLIMYLKDEKEIPMDQLASAVYLLLLETEKGFVEWKKIVVVN